ncbi:hypothetical protein Thermus77927_06810 [Thermus hydrothermalis]
MAQALQVKPGPMGGNAEGLRQGLRFRGHPLAQNPKGRPLPRQKRKAQAPPKPLQQGARPVLTGEEGATPRVIGPKAPGRGPEENLPLRQVLQVRQR